MPCCFSLEHYKECIELARDKGYSFSTISDYARLTIGKTRNNGIIEFDLVVNNTDKKVILMRHDVDFSLEYAYELAQLEYDLEIQSTYFIYMHSELYNSLSPKSVGMLKSISGCGHEIGLHADGTSYPGFMEENMLEDVIEKQVRSWTYHLPGLKEGLRIPYLLNPQTDIKIKYISDSGRNWREGCLCKNIGKHNKMHVLIHPEWWVSNGVTREDAVHKLWQSNLQTLVRNMTDIKQMLVEYVRDDLKQK